LGGRDFEIVLRLGFDNHRHPAGQFGHGLVAHITGLRNNDLIPRGHHRPQAQIDL
jgi:hypothetical protein